MPTPLHILVIEDDPAIGKNLVQGFTEAGHDCALATDGLVGAQLADGQKADAIVLDLMLPGCPGLEVLRMIRERGIRTPIVVLTAKGAVEERVRGLEFGADDYLVKPFAFVELLARIHAVCRRTSARPLATLQCGPLTLDLATRRVTLDGRDIDLTPTEFSLLELLMRYAGQVVTRKMLCEHIWGFDWDGPTNVIEVHVNRLRGKLDRGRTESVIRTVRGRGYSIASPPAACS
jgi:two-component system OmpR family response regulator/two-component system copper resistance phosphate regulon response regulator CusR